MLNHAFKAVQCVYGSFTTQRVTGPNKTMNVTLFFLWLELDVREGGTVTLPRLVFLLNYIFFTRFSPTQRLSVVVDYTDEAK